MSSSPVVLAHVALSRIAARFALAYPQVDLEIVAEEIGRCHPAEIALWGDARAGLETQRADSGPNASDIVGEGSIRPRNVLDDEVQEGRIRPSGHLPEKHVGDAPLGERWWAKQLRARRAF